MYCAGWMGKGLVLCPARSRSWFSRALHSLTLTCPVPWRLQRSLNIGEEQSKELLKCRNFYLNEMSKVVYERQKLLQTLHVSPATCAC